MIPLNEVYNMDCMDGLKLLDDNSIDLIVTDPPYSMSMGGGGCFRNREYWREITHKSLHNGFNIEILEEFKRILKKINIITFCSKNQLKLYLDWIYKNKYLWVLITWNKTNPIPATNNTYLPDTEYIFHIREKNKDSYGVYNTKKRYYLTKINKNNFNHPTVKPLHIIKNLVLNSSKENDIILDPFLGSGTTAVAAKQLNRNFIGFEISKEYCEIARNRLKQQNIKKWF